MEIGAGVLSQVQHSEKVTNGSKKRERGTLKQIQRHNFQQLVFLVRPYKKNTCSTIVLKLSRSWSEQTWSTAITFLKCVDQARPTRWVIEIGEMEGVMVSKAGSISE